MYVFRHTSEQWKATYIKMEITCFRFRKILLKQNILAERHYEFHFGGKS